MQEPLFDDSCLLLIQIVNGHLEVIPAGGQFKEYDRTVGREAYQLQDYLLEKAKEYGGIQLTPTGGIEIIPPRDKH